MPGRRRGTTWLDTTLNTVISEGAAGLLTALDGTLSVADSQGLTLTRMIGDLSFHSNTLAGGAWGVQRVAIGMGMCSREAFTAGVTPDPDSAVEETARGWVYRTILAVAQNGAGAPVVERIQFDIHAQRRLDSGRV